MSKLVHPMIQTQDLSKRFGSTKAVAELDLDIAHGEFFCFLGPNGAGKTTTIKMLTGLVRPTSGRAVVGGFDVQQQPLEAKRVLGYVPDHPYLYDRLTGREHLRFVAGLYRLSEAEFEARSNALLETFEIAQVADQLVENFSQGMRQKLSFASCFLHRPKIVVVDEPWVGLDPKNVRAVKTYLRDKADQGLTVFMSTHSLAIAEEVADRVGIIHRGRLLHVGTVEEIKALAHREEHPGARARPEYPGSLEDVFLELIREDEEGI